ncbi:LacI family DNA-binding transcriptional regulator [Lactiplantibacillus plantarum]|nr:LacI family DNA-binding transcriptional regulator [Lactiplantibacillus plantarum]MDV2575655.1 LacI family DNA-binding transcriptional regulator [Lactiplantibacillus plantarum]WQG54045.1 LacI family DNA-binding transcriptional regulator [Lactiplantibacillus plantarum]
MPTIREIAAKAGYSPATVSRLLNNDPSFSISDHARKKYYKLLKT